MAKLESGLRAGGDASANDPVLEDRGWKAVSLSPGDINAMFRRWLRGNNRRFPRTVCRVQASSQSPLDGQGMYRYFFYGTQENTWFSVGLAGITIYTGSGEDEITYAVEVKPAVTGKGKFTCSKCEHARRAWDEMLRDGKRPGWHRPKLKYFESLETLYAGHCFDKLLAWAQENLRD